MTRQEQEEMVQRTAEKLSEHFDDACVQILMSFSEGRSTVCINRGIGNWYARQGMAHEFIDMDVAHSNAMRLAEVINPPEDSE